MSRVPAQFHLGRLLNETSLLLIIRSLQCACFLVVTKYGMEALRCSPVKFEKLFENFFQIPRFQRDYVWGKDEVLYLLNDIDEFDPIEAADRYFIGGIVVYEENDKLTLIDGQQRLTTLYLILIALSKLFDGSETVSPAAMRMIESQMESQGMQGGEIREDYKLLLQNQGNREIVDKIRQDKTGEIKVRSITQAQKNLLNAYKTIQKWLLDKGVSQAYTFYKKLNESVNLVQITASSYSHARTIFSTINARGLGLDALDIVKDILYQNVDEASSDRLFDIWEEMKSSIADVDKDPMRFFRYFLMSHYETNGILTKARVLDWFEKNDEVVKFKSAPIAFLGSLRDSAAIYRGLVVDNETPRQEKSMNLEGIALLGGPAIRQHLMVLLGATSLEHDEFERLVRNLESVLFYSLLTEERSQSLETNMLRWSRMVREASFGAGDLLAVYDDMADSYADRIRQFFELSKTGEWPNTPSRLRYFLAKINLLVDSTDFAKASYGSIRQYATGRAFHIEHILPRTVKRSLLEDLGVDEEEYEKHLNCLGNLMLLDGAPNLAASNKEYSAKKDVYQQSNLRMVRHMVGKVDGTPKGGKFKDIVDTLCTFEDFNIESIRKRQEMLLKLAEKIWYLPHD